MSEKRPRDSYTPAQLWRGTVGLLAVVLAVGLALVVALALGWRSPTPHRTPDWTAADLVWSQYGEGTATLAENGYEIHLSQSGQRAWAVADLSITDFDLELDVRSLIPSEDVGLGLLYRYQDVANHYLFAIGGDGYYTIAVVREGELTPLRAWQQWPHVHRGAATNRLRVQCQGALCRFRINGEFTAEIIDDTFLVGNVGLWAQSFSDNGLQVEFTGLRLWSLN